MYTEVSYNIYSHIYSEQHRIVWYELRFCLTRKIYSSIYSITLYIHCILIHTKYFDIFLNISHFIVEKYLKNFTCWLIYMCIKYTAYNQHVIIYYFEWDKFSLALSFSHSLNITIPWIKIVFDATSIRYSEEKKIYITT